METKLGKTWSDRARMTRSTTRPLRVCVAAFALAACTSRSPATAASVAPSTDPAADTERAASEELHTRLQRLTAALDAARVEHHVPGLSIAVVKNDEVVLATGLGFANLETKTPATATTVYSIGSSTKAFTSTLVGMMVDEGKLAWDDPVAKYVPELRLPVDAKEPGAELTIRDALCHRSGFTRMSLIWASGARDDDEVWQLASKAEPWAKYREKFLYNNVVYASAGEAAARAAGTTYAELVQKRLFTPLEMRTTTVDQSRAEADPRRAQGYLWRSQENRFQPVPMRPITSIAPAGAIYSNAEEMAQWVRFQLAGGHVGDERLIEDATLAETRTPQISMSPALAYGLGWMLESRDGKTIVHHGGNIDGYAAMVAMMPQEQIGFVLLTNVSSTPLQNAAAEIVFDAMLGDLEPEAAPKEDLSKLTGTYVASFGGFKGDPLVVTARAGKLWVDVPRQMNFELLPPDDEGARAFAMTDQIRVSFAEERDGRPNVLRLHQAGFVFEAFREGWMPEPEIPLEELEPLLGEYRNDEIGTAKVRVQNNRLAVAIPEQGTFELSLPDGAGKRSFRARPEIQVELALSDGKPPRQMTVHQAGKAHVFTRDTRAAAKALPTVDELMKARGMERHARAMKKLGIVELRGKVRMPQSAIEGTVVMWVAADGRYATHVDLGKSGTIDDFVYPDRAWTSVSFGPLDEHRGKFLDQARTTHAFSLFEDWRTLFDGVEVVGPTSHDGRPGVEVVLRKGALAPVELVVDAKSGDVLSGKHVRLLDGNGGLLTTFAFSDYRTIQGVRVPMRQELRDEASGKTILELESLRRFDGDPSTVFPSGPPAK
jgi:CubicO group peptidase (beta-lactamase class C family)